MGYLLLLLEAEQEATDDGVLVLVPIVSPKRPRERTSE